MSELSCKSSFLHSCNLSFPRPPPPLLVFHFVVVVSMAELVDLTRAQRVFQTFAIETKAGSNTTREFHMPQVFLAVAVREMGYYPTKAHLETFVAGLPPALQGDIRFSVFVDLCRRLPDTCGLPAARVRSFVNSLGTQQYPASEQEAQLSTAGLRSLLLEEGTTEITEGEVQAVVHMLDPNGTGKVLLETLVQILVKYLNQSHPPLAAATTKTSRRQRRDSEEQRQHPSSSLAALQTPAAFVERSIYRVQVGDQANCFDPATPLDLLLCASSKFLVNDFGGSTGGEDGPPQETSAVGPSRLLEPAPMTSAGDHSTSVTSDGCSHAASWPKITNRKCCAVM